jgi:riboflavin biosynthesis pyrimidine reductase
VKVILIAAVTICGRIGPAVTGSRLDRRRLEDARGETQASLLGANTLRIGDPEMRETEGRLRPDRIRAVISGSGKVPLEGKKLFRHGPKPIVFTGADKQTTLQETLKEAAEVVAIPQGVGGLSLPAVLDFFEKREVRSLLVEGGGRLNYSALAQGVVDEILLTVMPVISGDRNAPAFVDGPESLGDPLFEFDLLSCEPVSTGEVFLHYRSNRTK